MTPWLAQVWSDAQPLIDDRSGVEWCEEFLRIPGSARSEKFDGSITPWSCAPLNMATNDKCRVVTYVKPVQCGGSVAGYGAICKRLATESGGDFQYNWEDDGKADDRWDKVFERILKSCKPVMARAPSLLKTDGYWKKGLILFPHCNFTMQGVFTSKNVASDTIRFQFNEEIHLWEPGRLAAADGRLTAVWNAVQFNISNAGTKGGQLQAKFASGTQEHWEVKCPGCSNPNHQANSVYHVMRSRWDDKRPQLGGLRYDAEGARLNGRQYDYNKLAPTIRYQMPCGYIVRNDRRERRSLSLSGRYGAPRNTGAPLSERSYTLDAVSVDYIDWLSLIREKHEALRALAFGDIEPYRRYVTERECQFFDPEERPTSGRVILNTSLKKDRAGLKDRLARFGALDRQQGSLARGELPHWWGMIQDFEAEGNSLIVWEGKVLTDEDAADVMRRHDVKPQCVAVDSGDDTTHVYQFCLKYGFNAIKGAPEAFFSHPDGARRIFSPERPLYLMINGQPTREDPMEEPMFWFYSKSGIRERLHYLRNSKSVRWDIPGDVSEDFKSHMESEELRERKSRTGETIFEWVQVRKRNDLFVCACYCAMLAEMAGIIGVGASMKNTNSGTQSPKHQNE